MKSKYLVFAMAFILVFSYIPITEATTGSYLAPGSANTSGPLIDRIFLQVLQTEAGQAAAVTAGDIQAPEWVFSLGAYTSLSSPVIQGTNTQNSWFGIQFNFAKFPGNNIHWRRAMQFLQDYGTIQTTVLNGVEGEATPDLLPCSVFGAACNTTPMSTYYSFDVQKAGEELCAMTVELTGSDCPVGPFTGASTWTCNIIAGDACPTGTGETFSPHLKYRISHHRQPWAEDVIIPNAGSIGLTFDTEASPYGTGGECFGANAAEVTLPGAYIGSGPNTGYNTAPAFDGPSIIADTCDMYTFGFISSTPAFNGNVQLFNSQFSGDPTNTGNYWSGTVTTPVVIPADAICGCPGFTQTGANNYDFTSNSVLLATSLAGAQAAAQDLATAYALNLPGIMAFYEGGLYADSADGWTNFVQAPVVGPNELAGLYWTTLNVYRCGTVTCTFGAVNGGTLGGDFTIALEKVSDLSGLNPLYAQNWVWQADVQQEVYDSQLVVLPADLAGVNVFTDYMTQSFSISNFGSLILGKGGSWYYFQQPCGPTITTCQGKAFQHPGPKQHGGIPVGDRTITNGQKVTFVLKNNVYFFDGVQVTAKDLVFSYDIFNIAGSPNYADSASPVRNIAAGSAGLIAAHTLSKPQCAALGGAKNMCVELYFGSQSFWNQGNAITFVMPSHLWQYFNPDHVSTLTFGAVDTSLPYDFAATAYSTSGAPHPSAASWMHYLNNLMVGSGPFYLQSWSTLAGTGELDRNPFYFNPNWQATAQMNPQPASYTLDTALIIPIHNPSAGTPLTCGPDAPGPIAPSGNGMCQLMGAGQPGVSWAAVGNNRVHVYDSGMNLVASPKLLKNTVTGHYTTVPLVTTGLPSGNYEVVLSTTYTFHGQHRVWYQVFGFST